MLEADDLTAALKAAESAARRRDRRRSTPSARPAAPRTSSCRRRSSGSPRERAALVAGLDKQRARARSKRSSRKRNGVAVAEARDGICTICHVRLRPQVFNTVLPQRRDPAVRHCNRILYFVPVPAAAATAPSDPSPQPAS